MLPRPSEDCPYCGQKLRRWRVRELGHCGHWRCRSTHERAERDARLVEQNQARYEMAREQRPKQALEQGIAEAGSHRVVVTPANTRRLAALPRARRYRFAARLLRLVRETLDAPQPARIRDRGTGDDAIAQLPIMATTCANCRGGCCESGGTHAYLDEESIRQFLEEHPQARPGDIVDAFCRHLPEETYRNSCVFHSATGCGLPRAMRSATCRGSLCSGLGELRNHIEFGGESKFFLAATEAEGVIRSRFEACDREGLDRDES